MDIEAWLSLPSRPEASAMLVEVNKRLRLGGMSITDEEAQMLSEHRAEALSNAELVEFGRPAIVSIAEAVATSPCLTQDDVAHDLTELQSAFYAIRSELPVDVPDEEINEALRGSLDEWGDTSTVASLPVNEVMRFSAEYVRATEAEATGEYRIVDDEGHVYTFDPNEWDYDEYADGWGGERWHDD